MIINHNISALNTYRQLSVNTTLQGKSLEKLSSGLRINRAGDDAAGLAISEKMRGQIRGLEMATKNAQDGISLIQTAEGALNETHAILQRMRELAVQAANDTNTDADRAELQKEVDQLAEELTRIAKTTEFNTQKLLDGTFSGTFHIGANEAQNLTLTIGNMDATTLGVAANEGVQYTQTTGDATNSVASFDATYTVTKLEDAVDIDDSDTTANTLTVNYVLVNDETGLVEAVSSDGGTYWALSAATDMDDLSSSAKITGDITTNTGFVFTDKVISGKVYSDDDGNALTGTNTISFEPGQGLSSGEYTVVGTAHALVSAGLGLLNANGELVAVSNTAHSQVSTAGAQWTNVAGDALLFDGNKVFAAGDTFTVSGAGGIDISSQTAADTAVTTIQKAIDAVSAERSKLGAYQNRLEHTINNLGASAENLTAAESRIRDVDMAEEMMEFTKMNILSQAATAMLAQANQQPQLVLQLLR